MLVLKVVRQSESLIRVKENSALEKKRL